jgi:hypothetical protein
VTRSQARTGFFVSEDGVSVERSLGTPLEVKAVKSRRGGSMMRKLALMAVNTWRSYLLVSPQLMVSIVLILGTLESAHSAEFFCSSGNVTCLVAAINEANGIPGEHVINLEPGSYTLQAIDNNDPPSIPCGIGCFGANGLPVISGSIRIQATAEDLPTVIERDLNAPNFRIFSVAVGGELNLEGITVQRGGGLIVNSPAILNVGVTSLQESIVTDSHGDFGTINNFGTFRVIRSIIADNSGGHDAGGIVNQPGGNLLVENSTIARNHSQGAGGILNDGSLVVKNSAIIFNSTDLGNPGGGIQNRGTAEIVNTTIAKNEAGVFGGGGVFNGVGIFTGLPGHVSIINSTIRENIARFSSFFGENAAGIVNEGTLKIQNTIVAGNTVFLGTVGLDPAEGVGPDCSGTITSLGNNLVGDPTDCDINLKPSDLTGDPGLGPLVEIGEDDSPGKAFYPVLPGSVVINRANPAACPKKDQLGNPRVGTCDIGALEFQGKMLVSVDVRPRSDANKINPNSSKNINVAIFSVNGFDATIVDPNTVRFGATGTEAAPVHIGRRDVAGDGDRDIVLRFQIPDTGIRCGDTSASLTGQTSNGVSFIGSSPIKTVQCKKQWGKR